MGILPVLGALLLKNCLLLCKAGENCLLRVRNTLDDKLARLQGKVSFYERFGLKLSALTKKDYSPRGYN